MLKVDRIAEQGPGRRDLRRDALLIELARIEPRDKDSRTELMACEMDRNAGSAVQAVAAAEKGRGRAEAKRREP